jgi:hypothetical protein
MLDKSPSKNTIWTVEPGKLVASISPTPTLVMSGASFSTILTLAKGRAANVQEPGGLNFATTETTSAWSGNAASFENALRFQLVSMVKGRFRAVRSAPRKGRSWPASSTCYRSAHRAWAQRAARY